MCKVILKALGLIQKNKEQKLLDAIFGAEREIDQYARLYGEHDMKSKNGAFEKEDSSKAVIGGGDPIESQKSLDHMSFSTPVTSLLSTHLFTKREEGIRDSSNFQNTLIPSEEYKEVETTLDVEDRDQNHHYLPFNINGSIAEKSIKCIDSR